MEDITKYVWFQEGPGVRKEQYTSNGVNYIVRFNKNEGEERSNKIVFYNNNEYVGEFVLTL